MFTGIVTDIGTLIALAVADDGRNLTIATAYDAASIDIGASIACDGVCLTVTDRGTDPSGAWISAFAGRETLAVTTLGAWEEGKRVNLERALRAGDELGGHMVLGHVDTVATVTAQQRTGDQLRVELAAPPEIMPFVARKGSVALNGTSLTVNDVQPDGFSVHLIPHTLSATNWNAVAVGDKVNLEIDPLARYAARLIETREGPNEPSG